MAKQPSGPPPPPAVQRLRLHYTKRGRLRFTSHRDIARAFERALRRAQVPMAYSAGFSPHPKISWVGAAPTGVASEAEYVEISVASRVDPGQLRHDLDESLPEGIDIVEVVQAQMGTSLPDRIQASQWEVVLDRVTPAALDHAVGLFLATPSVVVERLVKDGMRQLDARAAVVSAHSQPADVPAADLGDGAVSGPACATLMMVVRHVTPAVRPDDVLSGLRVVADLEMPVPPAATRLRQGPLTDTGEVDDPLAPDRVAPLAREDGATRQVDGLGGDAAGEQIPDPSAD